MMEKDLICSRSSGQSMGAKKKVLPLGMVVSGGLMSIAGAAFVAMYVRDAVIARSGEPDQSLLFWYLPFLFMGVIALLAGLGLGAWGFSILWKLRRGAPRPPVS